MILPFEFPDVASSAVGAIAVALRALGDPRPLHEFAGRSGFAFRLVYAAGAPRAALAPFPMAATLASAFERLGCSLDFVHAEAGEPDRERALADAVRLADAALARGTPVLAWEPLDAPELGAIVGREGARLIATGLASGGVACARLPRSRLGAGASGVLFVAAAARIEAIDARVADAAAIDAAVRRMRGETPAAPRVATGLAAFDAWIADLRGGAVDPAGHARLLAVAAESRAHAASFLTDVAERSSEGADVACVRAADELDASSQVIGGILRDVFANAEDVALAERRAIAAGMLATAKRREESAIRFLEEALAALRR